jgi:hypothetical protein
VNVWFAMTQAPCYCGYRNRGGSLRSVVVNKYSLRTKDGDVGLGWMDRRCRECQAPLGESRTVVYGLNAESLAKVNAYRVRKGWPELAQ